LFVALGFEFVNGFHDTANAVATVIYTHSLDPQLAVVWSGAWNFAGVLFSSGVVAFGIVSLLPGRPDSAGRQYVRVCDGLRPARCRDHLESRHLVSRPALVEFAHPDWIDHWSGIANQLIAPSTGTSSVDWTQAVGVGKSLLLSPLVGFLCAASLFLVAKAAIPRRELYVSPVGTAPPPFWIRLLLILTCTGVSFAHGSNDGQKGMGLIMLILIGTVPTAYALNRAVPPTHVHNFIAISAQAADALASRDGGTLSVTEPRDHLTAYIRSHTLAPDTVSRGPRHDS